MIKKSRLIKLITQNAVVYTLKKGEVYAMLLDLGLYEKIELDEKFLYIKDCSFTDIIPFEALFETRKQAEEKLLAIYKQALELACENIRDMYCSDYCACTRTEECKEKCCYKQYFDKEKILDQVKKKLEEGE